MGTIRVQRKRTDGWKKPEGAIYIGYRTKYGNPYKWKELSGGKKEAQELFKKWLPTAIKNGEIDVEPLRDKTIMCFCSPTDPCHGDVIIDYLNN